MLQELKSTTSRVAKNLQQCQACFKPRTSTSDNSSEPQKFFACTGCHEARYCSKECQTAHWSARKPVCKARRKARRQMEEQEKLMNIPSSEGPSFTPLTPTRFHDEVKAFSKYMRPFFAETALDLFDMSGCPDRWKDHLLLIHLRRLFPMNDKVPKWARFEAEHILPLSHSDFLEIDAQSATQFLDQIQNQDQYGTSAHGKPMLNIYITASQGIDIPTSKIGNIVRIACQDPIPDMLKTIQTHPSKEEYLPVLNGMMAMARDKIMKRESVATDMQQCQACFESKSPSLDGSEPTKLSACADCHQVRYCSKECQKAHWPIHKPVCKARQKEEFADICAREGISFGYLLPDDLHEEVDAFAKQTRSLYDEMAINLFDMAARPNRWRDHVLNIRLRRLFPMDDRVPKWARFEVEYILPRSYLDLAEMVDEQTATQVFNKIQEQSQANPRPPGIPMLSIYITASEGIDMSTPKINYVLGIVCHASIPDMLKAIQTHPSKEEYVQKLNEIMARARNQIMKREKMRV